MRSWIISLIGIQPLVSVSIVSPSHPALATMKSTDYSWTRRVGEEKCWHGPVGYVSLTHHHVLFFGSPSCCVDQRLIDVLTLINPVVRCAVGSLPFRGTRHRGSAVVIVRRFVVWCLLVMCAHPDPSPAWLCTSGYWSCEWTELNIPTMVNK